MKTALRTSILLICTLILIYCGYGILRETEISEGYRLFENVRMSSAGNGGINLSENDAHILASYIDALLLAEWNLCFKGFILGLVILLITVFQILSDKKKGTKT